LSADGRLLAFVAISGQPPDFGFYSRPPMWCWRGKSAGRSPAG